LFTIGKILWRRDFFEIILRCPALSRASEMREKLFEIQPFCLTATCFGHKKI
jgi:hypothetical protein